MPIKQQLAYSDRSANNKSSLSLPIAGYVEDLQFIPFTSPFPPVARTPG